MCKREYGEEGICAGMGDLGEEFMLGGGVVMQKGDMRWTKIYVGEGALWYEDLFWERRQKLKLGSTGNPRVTNI